MVRKLPHLPWSRILPLVLGTAAMFFLFGCLSVPRVETLMYNSAEGTVGLRVFSDSAYRAQHPTQFTPVHLRRLLSGIQVQEEKALIGSLLSRGGQPHRAFSDHEIAFLLPHLSKAFAQATPEEQVFFTLTHVDSERPHYSEGALYLSKQGIHVSLHSFYSPFRRVHMTERSSYGNTRPRRWSFQFSPPSPSSTRQKEPAPHRIPGTLTIPLITLLHPPADTVAVQPSAEPTSSPQSDNLNRDLGALKQEVRELRRALHDQQQQLHQFEQKGLRDPN